MRTSAAIPVQTSGVFVAASWACLFIGAIGYLIGLWNAPMQLNEKGYYFAVLVLGLYSAVALQKSVRDRLEGVPVTGVFYGLSWVAFITAVLLLLIGLWNATLSMSEKGFYGMAFVLALFASVAVQKNIRDRAANPVSEQATASAASLLDDTLR